VLVTTALAFFASVALAFLIEARGKALQDPEKAERWARLRAYLRFR
jgi:hypothetical protein